MTLAWICILVPIFITINVLMLYAGTEIPKASVESKFSSIIDRLILQAHPLTLEYTTLTIVQIILFREQLATITSSSRMEQLRLLILLRKSYKAQAFPYYQ